MWGIRRVLATVMAAVAASPREAKGDSLLMGKTCSMAEFACRSESQCIALDHYCNGVRDCDDGSDEPSGCTPCNRTYYGRIGSTYTLQVPRPPEHALPHFCQLTFIASGFVYGDLVMLSIEKFNLGRFVSHSKNGCPDGHMQIEELSRPLNKGYWCGTSLGTNTYYSETSAITIMLRVFNLTVNKISNPAAAANPQEVLILRLSYRFLQRQKANLRYGVPYNPHYRGKDKLGTFCDKYFENCDKKNCKVQSPNFPGMYPRNLTCFYHIRQTHIPAGKVPLIRVKQTNPHLIYIKYVNAPHLLREHRLYLDEDCHVIYDYLKLYDGNNTESPVLLKACKGGSLSSVTSSGPDLLIVFHASPYDFPFQDSPRRNVYGFMLDVEVLFVDVESTAYVRQNKSLSPLNTEVGFRSSCEWLISSRGQRSGFIEAPLHSLLANTTCVWRLLALPSEVVWLYFLHYKNVPHDEITQPQMCPNTLSIHDGDLSYGNSTLLKRICQADKFPLVCSGVHASGASVACTLSESYVSATRKLSISLLYSAGTIPAHVEFLARYEFVNKRQWGRALSHGGPCDRTFGPRPDRLFASPRDVFMYGRGGNHRLRCLYVFKVEKHQRIALRILRSKMGEGCSTVFRQTSKRRECSHGNLKSQPSIQLEENLWNEVEINRACICNISDTNPLTLVSYTNEIKLIYNIPYMTANNDFNNFFFEGDYEITEGPVSARGTRCKLEERRHNEQHGNFTIGAGGIVDPCAFLPRLVTVTNGAFLFMKVKGFRALEVNCGVASRINIYAAGGHSPIISVCPEPTDTYTHVFSHGWGDNLLNLWKNDSYPPPLHSLRKDRPWSRDLVIEYTGNYSGKALVSWMEVWQPLVPQEENLRQRKDEFQCPHVCPEIEACLPSDLWCDGITHCPSGIDEGAKACGLLAALPWASMVAAGALMISLVILLIAVIVHKISNAISGRRKRIKKQKSLPPAPNKRKPYKRETEESMNPTENDGAW